MSDEIHEFLLRHLNAILNNDIQTYHETTAEDLSLYEWWVTPHRIDGLPFHDFMMESNRARGSVFGSEAEAPPPTHSNNVGTRFDLANLRIQNYDHAAIASYTLLITTNSPDGARVASHNETRVMINENGTWKVVHVHKSPAWQAPHLDS